MSHVSIKGKPGQAKTLFTRSALTGAETVTATVAAGEVAIIIEDTTALDSLPIEVLVKDLVEAFRQAQFSGT